MLVIGLTGGFASGKSTVAQIFSNYGVAILDADLIARDVVDPKQPTLKLISAHFGEEILNSEGELNRAKLKQIIFHDSKERQWLENLLHPLISQIMQARLSQLKASYCILMVPLLLETRAIFPVDRILVVDVPEALQYQRAKVRDKLDDATIAAILATQASRQERLNKANDVIVNDKGMEELQAQVKKLHEFYLKLA